ncbi:uncharacterized protein [Diadema setosum]|uniref:uncharacterized protein n=1 Tax=Diadema setosum TaxID=31175 RepID=UPI003B3AB3EA
MNSSKSKGKSSKKMDPAPSSKPRLCQLQSGPDGYGFNLHGEKGHHGQYIRAVDKGSPADLSGLRSGDRVIEVDGVNIERETHSQVVARIKAGRGKTSLLVVDKELDVYCRKNGITIKASMAGKDITQVNGDHREEENEPGPEPRVNGEVAVVSVEAQPEESSPERAAEEEPKGEPEYAQIERREEEPAEKEEEEQEEDEVANAVATATAEAETGEEERREVEEEVAIEPEESAVVESVPVVAPAVDRDEDEDASVPEPEPEPTLEAASEPVVESSPPQDEPDVATEPESEPAREPTPEPEPVREPTPEPTPEPEQEPPREPTPEPTPAPAPAPAPTPKPEPVVAPVSAAKTESAPPPRPAAAPDQSGLNLMDMSKARQLAGGRKKKKQASAKNWEDKYAAFNNL